MQIKKILNIKYQEYCALVLRPRRAPLQCRGGDYQVFVTAVIYWFYKLQHRCPMQVKGDVLECGLFHYVLAQELLNCSKP